MFVELDFVRCPEWQIGAPGIDVYSSNDTNLVFDLNRPLRGYWPPVSSTVYKTSCDSLSTVQVRLTKRAFHIVWFVIVSFANEPDIEWVDIGEVRFLNVSEAENGSLFCNDTLPMSSSILAPSSSSTVSPFTSLTATPSPSLRVSSSAISPTETVTTIREPPSSSSIKTPGKYPLPPGVGDPIMTSLPSPSSPLPLDLIFIAVAAAMVLALGLLFAVLCFISFRYRSKIRRSRVGGTPDEHDFQSLPLPPTPTDSPTSSNILMSSSNQLMSGTNPLLLSEDSSSSLPYYDRQSGLYEHIPAEHMLPLLNESKVPSCIDIPVHSETASVAFSVSSTGFLDAANGCDGEPQVPSTIDRETLEPQDTYDPQDTYIDMKSSFHTASGDIEQILSRRIVVNEGIYSERIDPSDFASHGGGQGLDTIEDFEFLAPVYPTLSTLPEGFRPIIEVSGDNIKEISQLRIGQFGKTIQANTLNLSLKSIGLSKTDDNRDLALLVAVKRFCPHPSQFHVELEAFNRETKFLSQLKHPNVLRFLGVCYFNPVFIMMEYMEEGDLNSFLLNYSEIVPIVTPSSKNQVTTSHAGVRCVTDRQCHALPREFELHPSRSGHSQLLHRSQHGRQSRRFGRGHEPLQVPLLPNPRENAAPHSLDGHRVFQREILGEVRRVGIWCDHVGDVHSGQAAAVWLPRRRRGGWGGDPEFLGRAILPAPFKACGLYPARLRYHSMLLGTQHEAASNFFRASQVTSNAFVNGSSVFLPVFMFCDGAVCDPPIFVLIIQKTNYYV
ncbi:Class II receptor tyrosine kinase [Geodia barretti]|uniref:Class II receptor tyrosine kinase n=1 Tax=Geodia barretti TaxID=519541 RepID=A0AA35XAV9_GEOBA|nr:Class II receptor tyrosine kinase [Geodia barretti]